MEEAVSKCVALPLIPFITDEPYFIVVKCLDKPPCPINTSIIYHNDFKIIADCCKLSFDFRNALSDAVGLLQLPKSGQFQKWRSH